MENTFYKDDNGKSIYVGDILRSNYGYDVVVVKQQGEYVGRLICDTHSCKDIPSCLNNGHDHSNLSL